MVDSVPTTLATRALKAAGVEFVPRPYRYEEHGGTAVSSRELGVDEHAVEKTLVMETETKAPLMAPTENKDVIRGLNYAQQPPTIPHKLGIGRTLWHLFRTTRKSGSFAASAKAVWSSDHGT